MDEESANAEQQRNTAQRRVARSAQDQPLESSHDRNDNGASIAPLPRLPIAEARLIAWWNVLPSPASVRPIVLDWLPNPCIHCGIKVRMCLFHFALRLLIPLNRS